MKVLKNAFDRDLALFDASATLTYFRSQNSKNGPKEILKIQTRDLSEAQEYFPRLMLSIRDWLVDDSLLELLFFPVRQGSTFIYSMDAEGCAGLSHLFFIATKKDCIYQPGDCVELQEGETLEIPYAHLSYGFIGISSARRR